MQRGWRVTWGPGTAQKAPAQAGCCGGRNQVLKLWLAFGCRWLGNGRLAWDRGTTGASPARARKMPLGGPEGTGPLCSLTLNLGHLKPARQLLEVSRKCFTFPSARTNVTAL